MITRTRAASARSAVVSTWSTFFLSGALSAGWTVRVPAVKQKLQLSDGQLGFEVLGWGLAALLAMQLAGRLIGRIGSRRLLQFVLPGLALTLIPVGLASSYAWLLAAGALYGFVFGLLDIGMNTQAALIERRIGRSIMGRMHAGWSIGTVAGGLLGALGAGLGAGFTAAMLIFGLSGFPLAVIAGRWYLRDESVTGETPTESDRDRAHDARLPTDEPTTPSPSSTTVAVTTRARLPSFVVFLGIITFCVFLAEGAVADWSGVLMHEHLQATEVLVATAYPLFEGVMAVVRLSCEKWSERYSARGVVVASSLVTAAGLGVVASAVNPAMALAGFVVVGIGACLVGPLMISLAGRLDAGIATAAIARVSTLGYSGLLIGPVAIGLIGDVSNLRVGFAAVIIACVCWAAIGWWRLGAAHRATPGTETD